VTLFLLCDSLALDPGALTAERLALLHAVGERLEWIGIAAHDVVHQARDQRGGAPNAVAAWRRCTDPASREDDGAFLREVEVLAALPALLAERTDRMVDAAQVHASADAIRSYFARTPAPPAPA
jgi:hypothetical protein